MTEEEISQKIFQEAEKLSQKYGTEFDRSKYEHDAAILLQSNNSLSTLSPDDYKKSPDLSYNDNSEKGHSISVNRKNGTYSFTGFDGEEHQATNFYDMASQVALQYKKLHEKNGIKKPVAFHSSTKNPQDIEDNARAFINNGVMISPKGDIPNSPEFWEKFKTEYIKNNHTEEEWNKITANLPDELLGRPKKDKSQSHDGILITQLRGGKNPNLTPQTKSSEQRVKQTISPNMQQRIRNERIKESLQKTLR